PAAERPAVVTSSRSAFLEAGENDSALGSVSLAVAVPATSSALSAFREAPDNPPLFLNSFSPGPNASAWPSSWAAPLENDPLPDPLGRPRGNSQALPPPAAPSRLPDPAQAGGGGGSQNGAGRAAGGGAAGAGAAAGRHRADVPRRRRL